MAYLIALQLFRDLVDIGAITSWEEFCYLVVGQNSFDQITPTVEDLELAVLAIKVAYDVKLALVHDKLDSYTRHHTIASA